MKPKSIAILGAESSGKTTLAKLLGEHFNSAVVYEYAREYLADKNGKYDYKDLEIIAQEQVKRWFGAILQQPEMMIVDTELTVLRIWSELKYHKTSAWLEEHYQNQNIDLYLVCENDLPWENDQLRENQPIEEREEIKNLYIQELNKFQRDFVLISGQGETRLQNAIRAIEKHFNL